MVNIFSLNKCFFLKFLCTVIISLISIPSFSIDPKTQMDGDGFSDVCTRPNESWISFCNGYVQAVIDRITESDEICIPVGTTRTEIVTITEKEITSSAHLRSMNAHESVLSVMRRFYPC